MTTHSQFIKLASRGTQLCLVASEARPLPVAGVWRKDANSNYGMPSTEVDS